jgi:PadR family transcriptional regulator, regulatory protein PadR
MPHLNIPEDTFERLATKAGRRERPVDILCRAMYYPMHGVFMDMGAQVMTEGESREASNGKLDLELRRGVLVLTVLSQLRTAQYGYSLRQALAGEGMPIEEGTLYPLLRRLESLGLLVSEWRIEDGPPRRYYTLSPDGARHYQKLSASWSELVTTVNRLIANKK